ncbi:MAG: nucleotide sugar dehydrogenase [Candidatus Omnitrophica bacterium]|nr:nucleotide sugar dehydrogenase [Candidatus Omnitrophota bacterium]
MSEPTPLASKAVPIEEKIRTRTLKAGIIGLGYVGLPLAVEFAKAGIEIIGIDIDSQKVAQILRAESYIQDVSSGDIEKLLGRAKLSATTDFSVIRSLDTVNICVPTPLGKSKDPDISYIVSVAGEIKKYLHEGMLVILESTTYPGTTEEVILPMLEETGLKVGKDFFLAFSPERIDPANPVYNTRNIPKVVGGVTQKCTELAKAFYRLAIEKVHTVSSPRTAEMVKLLENTFRIVNIGLVNELCLMSEKLGVDIWEVIGAAATKPFGFMPFYPGPGLGGHCIPVDPHYLAWKARIHGFDPRFIDLASTVNREMPEFVVRKAQAILNERQKALNGSKVLILGVTYKRNINDIRESPALEVIELLEKDGASVSYADPFVPELILHEKLYQSISLDSSEFDRKDFDIAILLTDHDGFNFEAVLTRVPVLLDTRNACRSVARYREKIVRI